MSKVLVTRSLLEDIGDAIRTKTGESGDLTLPQMASAISEIQTISTYEYIKPEYFGLSYGYIATNGGFFANTTKQACVNLYFVEPNVEYIFFVGSTVSNRLRAHFYSGKTYADFSSYLLNSNSNSQIYQSTDNITGNYDLSGDRLKERLFYTPSSNGILFIGTSFESVLAPTILLKVNS
jgi:hypothetical protein